MSVQRIASRYAKSLIDLAIEQDKLERISEDVETFRQVAKNRDFALFLKNPIIQADKKAAIVKKIFTDKYDELTLSFLDILIRKGREAYLPDIATEYLIQYKQFKHISTVKVTSASPLSKETLDAIKKKLLDSGQTDTHLEVVTDVDPTLIGGMIIEFDGKVYDASVSHKLEKFKKQFKDNLYISQVVAS